MKPTAHEILTRRACLKRIAVAGAASGFASALWPRPVPAQGHGRAPRASEVEANVIAEIAREWMEKFKVPGLSIAIAKDGFLVHQQGFGMADTEGEAVAPRHLFRIASVAKPFTSVAIFSLIEKGRLKLDDLVFGADGHLGNDFGNDLPAVVEQITVHHLLTHTAGGWSNEANDPMFSHPAMNHQELISTTIRSRALNHAAGTHYAYSNFGYCILGRVIEKLTALHYAEAVKQLVLKPCRIQDMGIATNQRADGEVRYYEPNGQNCYDMNISRMDSHGGWIATAGDLVRFAIHVDGLDGTADILTPKTLQAMTTPTQANPNYACGWCVNGAPNWWHSGSLPGASSILVRTASGLCWAALANLRGEGIDLALDQMMWQMVKAVPAWQA